ncbi:MAG: FG-GAP repeat protein [Nitrosopumilus sp.]|nr:FG-GAP repeat protein [Nitrosopumilus sp.]MDH3489858.1 FG-GAP repeat protein [Nitrosopumilus sp.]MDH3516681.1 FG-GAP repeat protein [Nitrosopumilus sp.]MDH3564690.1 FG-GAP repeat protein [Nitrosopumilus sp.]MDH5417172.1 FG-GAP repeat protein [Nitrosopumilus sp.]
MRRILLSFTVLISLISLLSYIPDDDTSIVSKQGTHIIDMAFAIEYSPPMIISNPHDQSDFHFGQVLETVGDKIIIGNPDSNLAGSTSGSVFVYDEQLGNLLTTIKNPKPNPAADFGISLAELDKTRVVIGAPGVQNSEQQSQVGSTSGLDNSGAVYIFDVDSGEQLLEIYPPDKVSKMKFGASVDVTDNLDIIVGAPKASESGQSGGIVYLFTSSGELLLTISDPYGEQGSEFGSVVAAFGDDILVANPVAFTGKQQTGHVYLFDGKTGELIRTFEDNNNNNNNDSSKSFARFGNSISVNQNYVLIGAPKDNSSDSQAGSVFLFDGDSGELVHKITNPDPVPFGEFGSSVKLVDDYIFVGAPKNLGSFDVIPKENPEIISQPDVNVNVNPNSGIVFVFEIKSGNLLVTLENPTPNNDEHFGMTLTSFGNNIVVGTPFDTSGITKTGSVSVFYADGDSPYTHDRVKTTEALAIPSWVKNTSEWWSKDAISDAEFIDSIQYLITKGLIIVSQVEFNENAPQEIPDWIKTNAGWWAQDKISDFEFLNGIEFLIENGLLRT